MGPNLTRQRIYNVIAVLIVAYVVGTFGWMAILNYEQSHRSRFQFQLACGTIRVLTLDTLGCAPSVER
jgi:hypothetical protein